MRANNNAVQVIGKEKPISNDVSGHKHTIVTKSEGMFGKVRQLIAKVVGTDDDWFLQSKDWPYVWKRK